MFKPFYIISVRSNLKAKRNNKTAYRGAGATFDWLFFDNSKLIDFDC